MVGSSDGGITWRQRGEVAAKAGREKVLLLLASPTYRHGQLFPKAIVVAQLAVPHTVFVDEFGEFYVVTAVFGDFHELAFLEPLDGLHPFGRLFNAKRSVGD